MSSRFKHPRQIPLETPDNSSDSSDSENEEGKEIQVLLIQGCIDISRELFFLPLFTSSCKFGEFRGKRKFWKFYLKLSNFVPEIGLKKLTQFLLENDYLCEAPNFIQYFMKKFGGKI